MLLVFIADEWLYKQDAFDIDSVEDIEALEQFACYNMLKICRCI